MATPSDEHLSGTHPLPSDGQQDAVPGQSDRTEDANTISMDNKSDSPERQPATTTAGPNNNDSPDHDDSETDSSVSDAEEARETQAQSAPAVEWLATGREKRSTAGNRLKHMLAAQEPDDELELLFAEDGDDAAFSEADEDGSDLHMDSSSDDEDAQEQGDDLEGEKELEKKAQENRQARRKRKAQEAIPLKFRKKVKIAALPRSGSVTSSSAATPTTTAATTSGGRPAHAPRSKRKSERASWLPTAAEMPTRASRRETTMMSKEQLHQQMIEREVKRIKQVEAMERKAKKLGALRKPPKTQAERLAEAAIIEKKNAKSLNRWEEAEKQREEERRAKLAALNNRTLDGPVVTFWSGVGEWVDGKLKYVGKIVTIEEKPLKKKRGSGPDGDNTTDCVVDDTVMPDVAAAHPDNQTTAEAMMTDDGKQVAPSSTTTEEVSVPVPMPSAQPPPDQSKAMTAPQDRKTVQSIDSVTEAPSDAALNREMPITSGTAPATTTTAQADTQDSVISTPDVSVSGPPGPVPPAQNGAEITEPQPQPSTSAPSTTIESAESVSSHQAATSITPNSQVVETVSTNAGIGARSSAGTDLPLTADMVASSHENLMPETATVTQDTEMTDVQRQQTPDTAQIKPESPLQAPPSIPLNAEAQTSFPQPQAPGQAKYTTMGFAPPPQLATAVPQEGNNSTSSFLAHPTGVNSNGLSIPQIGHITPSSSSPHGLASPASAAALGSQAQLVSPETALPQSSQPQFRPVLSNVPVNVQSQTMTGQHQPTIAALPPKPRGGRQKKEKEKEASPPPPPRTPPPDGKATRNCFVLQNFNENAIKEKSVQTRILFGKEMNKLAKPAPAPRCVITGQPARYKDPRTGLPYYNSFAYKEIQKLQKGEYKFSSLLGTWVGSGSTAAAGVPARFLDPSAPGPPPPPPPPPVEVVEQLPAGIAGVGIGDRGIAVETVPADDVSSSAPDAKASPVLSQQPPLGSTQVPLTAAVSKVPVTVPTTLNGSTITPVATARDVVPSTGSGLVLPGTAIYSTPGQTPQVQPSGLAGDTGQKPVVPHAAALPVVTTAQTLPQETPLAQQ